MATAHALTALDFSPADEGPSRRWDVNRPGQEQPALDTAKEEAAPAEGLHLTEKQQAEEKLWRALAHRIVDLAALRRQSLKDVALGAGLAEGAVRDVVSGRSLNPRIGTLIAIAEALKVPAASLLPGEPTAAVEVEGGVQVYQLRLLERADRPQRSVVMVLPPRLQELARAGRLIAWQVDGPRQAAGLQRGDLVVADLELTRGDDDAPYLVERAGEDALRVMRVGKTLQPGERRLTVDGPHGERETATAPAKELRIIGRILYMARARIG